MFDIKPYLFKLIELQDKIMLTSFNFEKSYVDILFKNSGIFSCDVILSNCSKVLYIHNNYRKEMERNNIKINVKNGDKLRLLAKELNKKSSIKICFKNINFEKIEIDENRIKNKFSNEDSYSEYIKNKSVIIVGPADNVNCGKFIDSFDVVVRINSGDCLTEQSEKYGNRTDVVYHCVNTNKKHGGEINYMEKIKFLVFAHPILSAKESLSFAHGNIKDYLNIEIDKKYNDKVTVVDKNKYINFENELGCRPNAGTVAIWNILKHNPKSTFITGFTLFQTRFNEKYREINNSTTLKVMKKFGTHDQNKIAQYYKYILQNNLIDGDNDFKRIINELSGDNIYKTKKCDLNSNFEVNDNLSEYIVTLLGYNSIKTDGSRHTNWFPWNRFLDVYKTIGYKCEWTDLNNLKRGNEKRIFITWNDPTSLELYQSNKVKKDDIIFQKLTSLGKGMESVNWTNNPKEWCKTWNWRIYQTVEYLYDLGLNVYAFGCKTQYDEFPEKKRICEKLKDRIFWITWGGTPFNWNQIKNSEPEMTNFSNDISFVGSKWGRVGRGNIDAWKKYLEPLEKCKYKFNQYGGIGNKMVTDDEMVEILKKSKICPIIHAPSWQAERGIQDRFYTVFLSGRFGICDNLGAIDIFGEEIKDICTENPKEYYEKTIYYLKNPDKQLEHIKFIQNKIKEKFNFYRQWENIFNNLKVNNIPNILYKPLVVNNNNKIRYIVTSSDNNYFDSFVLSLSNLYENYDLEFFKIIILDLGMTDHHLNLLSKFKRILVIKYSESFYNIKNKFSYFWKIWLFNNLDKYTEVNNNTSILYVDSGIYINNLSGIFKSIDENDYMLFDMSYKSSWNTNCENLRIFNYIDKLDIETLEITKEIASKKLLLFGLLGFKYNSEFYKKVIKKTIDKKYLTLFDNSHQKFKKIIFKNRSGIEKELFNSNIKYCTPDYIGNLSDMKIFNVILHKNIKDPKIYEGKQFIEEICNSKKSKENYLRDKEKNKKDIVFNNKLPSKHFIIHRNTIKLVDKNSIELNINYLNKIYNSKYKNNNEEIKKKFENKRVVIVGPANHLFENEYGKLIDSYDLVVRLNKFRRNKLFDKNIGFKSDVLVHCLSETENCGGLISDSVINENILIAAYPVLELSDSTFKYVYGNLKNYNNFFKKYSNKIKIFIPDDNEYINIEKKCNKTRPNTGICGIVHILNNFDVEELFVTGFTFFKDGYHESYRHQDEKNVLQLMKSKGFHNQDYQIEFFNNFLFNKKQLTVDYKLYEIMNNYNEITKDEVTIMGNGPSLKNIERKTLRNTILVSYNRCFIIYKNENIYPLYYFCIDKAVLINCLSNIEELLDSPIKYFVLLKCTQTEHLKYNKKVQLVEKNNNNKLYFGDVATFSIHYLFEQGYIKFNVYGCDCSYIEDFDKLNVDVEYNNNDPARRIVLKPKKGSKDPNHFLDNYFDHSTEYSVPRTNNHLNCWEELSKIKNIKIIFKTKSNAGKFINI